MKRILIAGYYGFGNTGDEAILAAMVEGMQRQLPGAEITVVSGDPRTTSKYYGVRAIDWREMGSLVNSCRETDLIIVGGGGLFHDYWEFEPRSIITPLHSGLAFPLTFAALAAILGKPLVLHAVGVGPLFTESGKMFTRAAFEQAHLASVRDEESRDLLASIGVDVERVEVTADPSLLLSISPDPSQELLSRLGIETAGPRIAVALRQWEIGVSPEWPGDVAEALDRIAVRLDADFIFVPFQSLPWRLVDDDAVSADVRGRMKEGGRVHIAPSDLSLWDKAALVGSCDLVLAMRFHSVLFGALAGVPPVALVYDPKVRHAMRSLGRSEYAMELHEASSDAIESLLVRAWEERDGAKELMHEKLEEMRVRAGRSLQDVAEVVSRPPAPAGAAPQMALLLGDAVTTRVTRVEELEKTISHLRTFAMEEQGTLADLRSRFEERKDAIAGAEAALRERDQTIGSLRAELDSIYGSRGWRLLLRLWKFRSKVLPGGSFRARLAAFLVLGPVRALRRVRTRDEARERAKLEERGLVQWVRDKRESVAPSGSKREALLRGGARATRRIRRARLAGGVPAQEAALPAERATPLGEPAYTMPVPAPFQSWLPNPDLFSLQHFPLVSVVLPVYNQADLLVEAVEAVLAQSYSNVELIIVDDGSTDEIEEALDAFRFLPCVRILRQPNQKLPRALTHGHEHASGDFITWTSADNIMAPDAIAILAGVLMADAGAAASFADVAVIDDDGRVQGGGSYRPQNRDELRPEVLRLYRSDRPLGFEVDNYINACFLYRSQHSRALEGRFADDLRGVEDYDFWLRLQKCGPIVHAGNDEPLYLYRDHSRSMSHGLLTRELDSHMARVGKLIDFERVRRDYREKRWTVVAGAGLKEGDREHLLASAQALPVDIDPAGGGGWARGEKRLVFLDTPKESPIWVQPHGAFWRLSWTSPGAEEVRSIDVFRGTEISPLAMKARDHAAIGLFPGAGTRPVIGCHLDFGTLRDPGAARAVVEANSWAFFVFVDAGDPVASKIMDGLENSARIGARDLGQPYQLYAGFDALWCPRSQYATYRDALALSYAIGRPLIVEEGEGLVPAPFQIQVEEPTDWERLKAGLLRKRAVLPRSILDSHLDAWTKVASMGEVLRLADGITQEWEMERPDFAHPAAKAVAPVPWVSSLASRDGGLKAGIAVNALDVGGLEAVVEVMTGALSSTGVDVFVLCNNTGGRTAEKLRSRGITVHEALGDPDWMRDILREERPDLVNSHWVDLPVLEACSELEIPVIETIHNAYVWLGAWGWGIERQRSKFFSGAVAVSALVRDYYVKWNGELPASSIDVVPNAVNPIDLQLIDRAEARRRLGVNPDAFVFLSLASYHNRKNQMATMRAFDEAFSSDDHAILYLAGNVMDDDYFAAIKSQWEALGSRDRVILDTFRSDRGLLMSAADAFLLNSFFEGWSIAATEALVSGIPVVHSDCGSGRELVGDGRSGFLIDNPGGDPVFMEYDTVVRVSYETQQRNTPELVDAMRKLAGERGLWRLRKPSIRNHAIRAFDPAAMAGRYAEVFARVVDSKR